MVAEPATTPKAASSSLRDRLLLAAPVLAFGALRGAILLSAPDRISVVGEAEVDLSRYAFDRLRPEGPGTLQSYLSVDFHGGTLVFALLYAPVAALFGASWLSLKALAMALSWAAQLCWMGALNRAAGLTAALVFGWLFALAPPLLLTAQLTAWGNHAESHVLLGLGLWIATSLHGGRAWRCLALGAVFGFAVFFNRLNLVFGATVVLGCIPAVLTGVAGREPGLPPMPGSPSGGVLLRVLALVVGLALGMSPLAWQWSVGGDPTQVYLQGPSALLDAAAERLRLAPAHLLDLPLLSPADPHGPWRSWLRVQHALLWASVPVALLTLIRRRDARLAAPLGAAILYAGLFFLVLHAVHLPWNNPEADRLIATPRYTISLYLPLFAALGVLVSRGGAWLRVPALSLALSIVVPAAVADLAFVAPETPTLALNYDALSLARRGIHSTNRLNHDGLRVLATLEDGKDKPPIAFTRGARWAVERRLLEWYGDVLAYPSPRPSLHTIEQRRVAAWEGRSPDDDPVVFMAGFEWGARILLGQWEPIPPEAAPTPP